MFLHRVQMDVMNMLVVILEVANPVVGETSLPNLDIGTKFLLHPEREAALDELDSSLQCHRRCDQQVKVIRHQDEFVQKISFSSMRQKYLEEYPRPRFRA